MRYVAGSIPIVLRRHVTALLLNKVSTFQSHTDIEGIDYLRLGIAFRSRVPAALGAKRIL